MSRSRGFDAPVNELDLFGNGGGSLSSFMFNYGPSGAPSNAPPTAFERGLTRADPSEFGMFAGVNNNEMPPPGDDQRPSDNPGGEDSPFDIIMRTIVGQIGNPEGVSPQVIAVLNGYLDGSSSSELEEIGREIVAAGGFEEWLATQNIVLGDPGGVDDTTQTSTEIIFDENGNPVEIIIDPTLITLPPILGDPEDPPAPDPNGGGGSGGGTEGGGDNTSGGGSVEGSEGNQDSIDDGFFRVENGTVYVRDLETNEWIISPRDWGGLLGENPSDGYYTDTGVRIDDGSEVNVGGDDEGSGGGEVTVTPGTGGTTGTGGTGNTGGTTSGGNSGGGNQSGGGTGGTGGGNQTGNTGDTGSGQNPGDGTSGSGGGSGTGTGTGTGSGSGSGSGNGTGNSLFKDAVNKFQGVDATVRFNDPGIPQLIGGRKPQRQSIMGLFEEYL